MNIINVVSAKNVSKSMTENQFLRPRIFGQHDSDKEDPKQSLSVTDLNDQKAVLESATHNLRMATIERKRMSRAEAYNAQQKLTSDGRTSQTQWKLTIASRSPRQPIPARGKSTAAATTNLKSPVPLATSHVEATSPRFWQSAARTQRAEASPG